MAKYTSRPFGTKTQGDRSTPNKTQIAAAYDILSEGEIEGLADGFASVYINDVPVIDSLANEIVKNRNLVLNTTANNTTISSSVFGAVGGLTNNNATGLSLGIRYVLLEKAGKKGTGIASATKDSNTITTSSNFFTTELIASLRSKPIKGYITLAGAGANGTDLVTVGTFVSATEITIEDLVATTVSNADIFTDHVSKVSSISGNDATLSVAPGVSLTSAAGVLTGAITTDDNLKNLFNIENLQFGLNTGVLNQPPISMNTSFGQASIIASPNIELEQGNLRANVGTTGNLVNAYNNELDEPSQLEGSSADTLMTSAFLEVSNPSEVDEVHLTFNLPSCHAIKNSSGAKGPSYVELQIFFEYSTDGGSSYTSELAFGPSNNDILTRSRGLHIFARSMSDLPNNGYIKPSKAQYAAFVEEFIINTEEFQPFDDFRIRVRRINDLNFKDGSFQHNNSCTLTTVESIIKDKLTYPHTAYTFTSFNAKDYEGTVPTRAFALKGVKLQVPTNYRTREETGGAAAYTRNITSGATESSYQNWDGNFRGDIQTFNQASINHEKVFCDNPVWIMYDMLTNNRYGMGQFIDKDNIDKYELFRLAKYCDEEIPDGNGGTEPRFTCNVYFSEAGEATTVLKQLASVFHGMTLWANGEFTAVSDSPKQPVALFSKANIINGQFTYEGTGERVRTNQVKVTWNDPEDNYRQSTEYVEDYESIAETGRIVRSEQLAFGCTSRGQAHRMGKWKLISEKNEKETVSFETGQNAIGLLPGQVIAIQDADRDRVSYAGRVSNTGTLTTTVIPLDRTISLPAYDSAFPHELVLMYPKGGAYLTDDSATIGGVAYVKGDLVTSITSSIEAVNEEANLAWTEEFTTEIQPITTSAGNVSSLTVSSAFTSAPNTETIWALKLYNTDGTQKVGALKEYKIVAIKEDEGKFSIAAAEYYREKFTEIERGYGLEARPTKESADPDDVVPTPKNLVITVEPMDSSDNTSSTDISGVITGNKATLSWDYPLNADGSKYKFANGFEIVHNFNGDETTELVNSINQSFTIDNISAGVYNVRLRTKTAIGSVSQFIKRDIEIAEAELVTPGVSRTELVPQGGTSSRNLLVTGSVLEFSSNSYSFTNPNGVTFTNTSSTEATYKQDFNGMGTEAYLLFDSSETTDKLKALKIINQTDSVPPVSYFGDISTSTNGLSSTSGTVIIERFSNQVDGTGTSFTTELNVGNLIQITNGSNTTQATSGATTESKSVTLSGTNSNISVGQTVTGTGISGVTYVEAISGTTLTLGNKQTIASGTTLTFSVYESFARVRSIESNTLLYLEQIVQRPFSSSLKVQAFIPDFTNDAILAKIKLTSGTYSIEELYVSAGGEKGDQGPVGPKGGIGIKGDTGVTGQKGEGGSTGDKGAKGGAGETGPKGLPGAAGEKGGPGATGEKGPKGGIGPKGLLGDTGAKGATGEKGETGSKGLKGDFGQKGVKGGTGETGEKGLKGDFGPKGLVGPTGDTGDKGLKGEFGPKGLVGPTGGTGDKGLKGEFGAKGLVGPTGLTGDKGLKGEFGPKGLVGPTGLTGPKGLIGDFGPKGATGGVGDTGPKGAVGPTGAKGGIGGPGPAGGPGDTGDKGIKGQTGLQGGTGVKGDPGDEVFLIYYDGLKNDVLNSNAAVTTTSKPLAPDMDGGSSAISNLFRLTQKDGTVTDWYTEAAALSNWYFVASAVTPAFDQSPRTEWTVSEYLQGEKGETGAQGAKGAPGGPGETGPKGAVGPTGQKGGPGAVGAKGATGGPGATGEKGGPGDGGAKGATGGPGAPGEKGGPGAGGAKGATGGPGATGEKGGPGAGGQKGATGGPGVTGDKGGPGEGGPKGATGVPGSPGEKGGPGAGGQKGATGGPGVVGEKGGPGDGGQKGATGGPGATGEKGGPGDGGQKGATGGPGATGEKGGPGATGQKGATGGPGATGEKGGPGQQGAKGAPGQQGVKGATGGPGATGEKGLLGQTGVKGATGSPGADAPYVVIGFDNTVDTNAERTTAIKTFSGLSVVKVNSVYWDATTGVPHQNQASEASNPTLTPLTGTNALISADTISVQDLILPTTGSRVSGSIIGNFNTNSLRYAEVCEVGTGAGFYQGFVRAKGGTGQVKTIHFLFSDGTVNTTVTSGGTDTTELGENSSGVIYKTPLIQKLPGLVSDSRLTSSDDTTNIPLAFRYDGTGTVTLYIYGQGDSNARQVEYVEGRFIKFGVSTPTQFTFTDVSNATASSTQTSNTITLSGSAFVSGTASINLGTFSVNGGAHSGTSRTVSNGDTIQLQGVAYSTGGASKNHIFTVSDTSDTWTITTTGGIPSGPKGPSGPIP